MSESNDFKEGLNFFLNKDYANAEKFLEKQQSRVTQRLSSVLAICTIMAMALQRTNGKLWLYFVNLQNSDLRHHKLIWALCILKGLVLSKTSSKHLCG